MTKLQTIKQKQKNTVPIKPRNVMKLMLIIIMASPLILGGYATAQSIEERLSSTNADNGNLQSQQQNLIYEAESLEAAIISLHPLLGHTPA